MIADGLYIDNVLRGMLSATMIGLKLSNRYEILQEIGRGGMGVVYRARDPMLDRDVAVKVMAPRLFTAQNQERFRREARMLGKMDHPSIVTVHDIGEHEGSLFLVMPLISGNSLRGLMDGHSLILGDLITIGIQTAEALSYSHSQGVIHRDIKPENILITASESGDLRVKVTDFGLARRSTDERLTDTGAFVGTIAYLSPEQILREEPDLDPRSDIYSLGVVLYECMAGKPPFYGEMQAVLYRIANEMPDSLRGKGVAIDEELEAIVLQCLEKEAANRPTASEFGESLSLYASRISILEKSRKVSSARKEIHFHRAAVSEFIGRQEELNDLQMLLNAAIQGDCRFVVLSGPAGIGKTRLLDELDGIARARKIPVIRGRFAEENQSFPYQGFCELLQGYFRFRSNAGSDFSDLAPDLISLFPMLAEMEGFRGSTPSGPTSYPVSSQKPEERTHIFELLSRTITRIIAGSPMVLLLEDLHLASVSLDALQFIVRRLGPVPALIVATYRSTEVDKHHPLRRLLDSFQGDKRFKQIQLGPLKREEYNRILMEFTGAVRIDERLQQRLFEATEGNPYFTREMVRSLIESGSVKVLPDGSCNVVDERHLTTEDLPETIRQIVERRIENLSEFLREILSTASVLGKSFDYWDLEFLCEKPDGFEEKVEQLLQEGFIEEERSSRGDQLSFSSGIMRDVLYGRLSRRKRRSLHRRFGEYLERGHSGKLDRVYSQLVHHFSQADVPEKTVEYGLKLARKSLEAFSPDEAIRAARIVLDFQDEEYANPMMEAAAHEMLGLSFRISGNVESALKEFTAAIRICEEQNELQEMVRLIVAAAETAWSGRRIEDTGRWVEKGLEAIHLTDDLSHKKRIYSLAATMANLRADYERAKEFLEEVERLQPSPARNPESLIGGTLHVSMTSPVHAFHPVNLRLNDEQEIFANIFETLFTTDEQGALQPFLCERYEQQQKGQVFLFILRSAAKFENGNPVTAESVQRSFEEAKILCETVEPAGLAAIESMTVHNQQTLEIRLKEALPIYPALLTDSRTGIALEESHQWTGTGPFRIKSMQADSVILERSRGYWRGIQSCVEAVHFHIAMTSAEITGHFRSGHLDLVKDLTPEHLDQILRDRKLRAGLVEAPRKNVYFVLFNTSSAAACLPPAREALCGIIRTSDLVRRTLGRYAEPSEAFLPPGILGHDPGKRRSYITRERAEHLLDACHLRRPLQLKASVHPILQDRHASLLKALQEIWKEIGVEISIETPDMTTFLERGLNNEEIDLMIGRWIADYDDPDNFTYGLFHSKAGRFRNYYCSEELDHQIEQARAETQSLTRERIYRKIDNHLTDAFVCLPLFHDIDYRLAHPKVRQLNLRSSPPYVNYSELALAKTLPRTAEKSGTAVLHVPIAGMIRNLDPTLVSLTVQSELIPNVFECLMRETTEARIIPWLASDCSMENHGKRFRFRLRENLRFHDGRRLTSRDVRYSFERLLQNEASPTRWLLAPISGAKELIEGTVGDLAGFRILSALEFSIELEQPVSFFPALLAYSSTAIIPEGSNEFVKSWRDGCVGTGPFRVVRFDPGYRLELEANPYYWRPEYPKCEGIVFHLNQTSQKILAGFREGRYMLAWDLLLSDVEALRKDPQYASGYKETPRLCTYYIVFNSRKGPLQEQRLRKILTQGVDVETLVRKALGGLGIPAGGIIPPGLLGHEPGMKKPPSTTKEHGDGLILRCNHHSLYGGPYSGLVRDLFESIRNLGFEVEIVDSRSEYYDKSKALENIDLNVTRWVADYADADTFIHGLLHSEKGHEGRFCSTPEIDQLIEKGRTETDPSMRHSIYRKVEELIQEHALLLPLFYEQAYRFTRPEVDGLELSFASPTVAYEKLSLRR